MKKAKKILIVGVLTITMACAIILSACTDGGVSRSEFDTLRSELAALRSEYDELKGDFDEKETLFVSTQDELDALRLELVELRRQQIVLPEDEPYTPPNKDDDDDTVYPFNLKLYSGAWIASWYFDDFIEDSVTILDNQEMFDDFIPNEMKAAYDELTTLPHFGGTDFETDYPWSAVDFSSRMLVVYMFMQPNFAVPYKIDSVEIDDKTLHVAFREVVINGQFFNEIGGLACWVFELDKAAIDGAEFTFIGAPVAP